MLFLCRKSSIRQLKTQQTAWLLLQVLGSCGLIRFIRHKKKGGKTDWVNERKTLRFALSLGR